MRRLAFTLLAISLAIACGTSAVSDMMDVTGSLIGDAGRVLRDAGAWLDEAGSSLSDAGHSVRDAGQQMRGDAQAQVGNAETYDVNCDAVYRRTVTSASATVVSTQWFAELAIDTDDLVGVDTLRCGRTVHGTDPYQPTLTCQDGSTCTGTTRPSIPDCEAGSYAEIGAGLVRVYCGYSSKSSLNDGSAVESGVHFARVRVAVRRTN